MRERRIYQFSLALPIVLPVIVVGAMMLLASVAPPEASAIPPEQGGLQGSWAIVALILMYSVMIGGIPYVILALALLFWMRNKKLSQIRWALVVSPLLLIALFSLMSLPMTIFNENSVGSLIKVLPMWSMYILAFGYFYVFITFCLALLFRGRRFDEFEDDNRDQLA